MFPCLVLVLTPSIIARAPQQFAAITEDLVCSQPPDRQPQLLAEISKLMEGVNNNLQSANREKFTQNLTVFRHDVKAFIVIR